MIQANGQQAGPTESTVPFVKISLSNAALLSSLYLGLGALLELARRVFEVSWAEQGLRALETFPMRMLGLVGMEQPLVRAYLSGQYSSLQVRLLLNATTVVVISILALGVGMMMSLLSRLTRPPTVPPIA